MSIYNYLVYDEKDKFEKEVQNSKNINIYQALQAAILKDFTKANIYISKVDRKSLTDVEDALILEAKALISYGRVEFESAREFAQEAIQKNDKLFFSYSILGITSEFNRKFADAMIYYKIILETYPEHNNTLLNMARTMLILKQNYKDILKIVRACKPSLRRNLYLYLIPFGKPLLRIIFFILTLIFFVSTWGNILFYSLLVSTLALLIYSILKLGADFLILTRIILLQVMIIFSEVIVILWRATI